MGDEPRDFWLNKLFYDLHNDPAAARAYRANRAATLDRYPLDAEVRRALEQDDVGYLAKLVNPYLLRFYFAAAGFPDEKFIAQIKESRAAAMRENGGG